MPVTAESVWGLSDVVRLSRSDVIAANKTTEVLIISLIYCVEAIDKVVLDNLRFLLVSTQIVEGKRVRGKFRPRAKGKITICR